MGIGDFVKELLGIDTLESLEERDNAIDVLKADHRKVDLLFREFEKNEENSNKQEILDMILTELSVHALLEEELVYPLLQKEEPAKIGEAHEEHHLVKILLSELSSTSADAEETKPKVKVLSELVKHHVKEEERELFPALSNLETDLCELGQKVKARKAELLASPDISKPLSGVKGVVEDRTLPAKRISLSAKAANSDSANKSLDRKQAKASVESKKPADKKPVEKSAKGKTAVGKKTATAKTSAKKPATSKATGRKAVAKPRGKKVSELPKKSSRKAS